MSPRRLHMVFSTREPPTIQRMPWPVGNHEDNGSGEDRPTLSYDTWLLNDLDFSWLVEADGKDLARLTSLVLELFPVHVAQISHSKAVDGEVWITSDGRVYLVGLHDNTRGPEKTTNDNDEVSAVFLPSRVYL